MIILDNPKTGGGSASFASLSGAPGDNAALAAELAAKASLTGAVFVGDVGLANTTAATVSVPQPSPNFELEGRGWKTNAPAGSATIKLRALLTATNGAPTPQDSFQLHRWDGTAWYRCFELNRIDGTFHDETELLLSGKTNNHARVGFRNYEVAMLVRSYSSWLGTRTMGHIGWLNDRPGFAVPSNGAFGWSQYNDSSEYGGYVIDGMFLEREGLGVWRFMSNHATTATPVTLKAHNVTTGVGASLTLAGGTGSGGRGNVVLHGGNRAPYNASPSLTDIRDILISHGLMAAS